MVESSVMVVEDEGIVAKDIQHRLEGFGYSVPALASSAGEAIRMAEFSRPDIVLMDVVLQGDRDGIDAAEQIRERFDIPVVFLSAYADEKTLRRAKRSEPYGYLVKPFNEVELRTTIEIALFKHQMERKLRQSEGWLSAILGSVGEAVIATDAAGRIRFMNRVAERITGWPQTDALDRQWQEVCPMGKAGVDSGIGSLVSEVLREHVPAVRSRPGVLTSRDGSTTHVLGSAAPIPRADGTLTGAVVIMHDVSERQKSEDALRKSEERYRFLVENAPDAIFGLSHQAIILDLNHAFATLTGWESTEWIGKSFTDLVHADDLAEAQYLFRRSSQGEPSTTRELRIRKKSGEYMHWEFTTTSQIENGKSIAILGIARDITERKKFEEQIRQSQKMDSVGILAGGVAHDFNNLLSVIMGHTTLLERFGSDPGRRAESLARIQQASERGAALVRQLLTVARKVETTLQVTSINEIVHEVAVLVGETFPKTITIDVHCDPDLPAIIADGNQIHQMLLNLCVNARDAMPRGGTISISTSVVPREKLPGRFPDSSAPSYLLLAVADTGEGMDETTRTRIFEPFFTTKGPGKGMGLGLAVSYGIIKNHSGFINVESTVGAGSVFRVYFPIRRVEKVRNTSGREIASGSSGGTETILLVEDEEALMNLVKDMLTSRGYNVLTARDGEQALAIFSESHSGIGLVFSDIGLPRLGGEEMLKKMQEIDPKVRVIFSSGYLDPDLRTLLLEKGATDFIQKPHNPELISTKIREVLDREKS